MMMPTQPAPRLVLVETDFAFGFFKDGFNWPAHPTQAYELNQRRIGGRIAEIVFDHERVVQIAADDQPEFLAGQVVARFSYTQKSKVANNGALTAFFNSGAKPVLWGNVSHQLFDLKRMLVCLAQTQAGWATPATFPLGHVYFGWGAPEGSGVFDLREIPLAQNIDSISKRGRIPVQLIGRYPLKGQMTAFCRFFQQA